MPRCVAIGSAAAAAAAALPIRAAFLADD